MPLTRIPHQPLPLPAQRPPTLLALAVPPPPPPVTPPSAPRAHVQLHIAMGCPVRSYNE